jgi:7-keto-8-aminopelargonate synthetase-like enzyme
MQQYTPQGNSRAWQLHDKPKQAATKPASKPAEAAGCCNPCHASMQEKMLLQVPHAVTFACSYPPLACAAAASSYQTIIMYSMYCAGVHCMQL